MYELQHLATFIYIYVHFFTFIYIFLFHWGTIRENNYNYTK